MEISILHCLVSVLHDRERECVCVCVCVCVLWLVWALLHVSKLASEPAMGVMRA